MRDLESRIFAVAADGQALADVSFAVAALHVPLSIYQFMGVGLLGHLQGFLAVS